MKAPILNLIKVYQICYPLTCERSHELDEPVLILPKVTQEQPPQGRVEQGPALHVRLVLRGSQEGEVLHLSRESGGKEWVIQMGEGDG